MKKLILFSLGVVCLISCGRSQSESQTPAKIKPLQIGDTVPDIVFRHIINYKTTSAKLSDFRGKLLILDFWDTWCGSCLEAMPRLDSIQKLFKGKIQILPVSDEPAERVRKALVHNKLLAKLELPSVAQDSLLSRLFPHTLVPHEVWIDNKGKVLAITESSQVTAQHIREILRGEEVKLIAKNDRLNYDPNKPLLLNNNGGNINKLLYHSEITGYLNGLPSEQGIRSYKNGKRIFATNVTILSLYRLAYKNLWRMPQNRVVLQTKDSSKYRSGGKHNWENINWRQQNLYCYELILSKKNSEQYRRYVKQDLDRFFYLNGRMDTIPVKCWLLVRLKDKPIIKSKAAKSTNNLFSTDQKKFMKNTSLKTLVASLNQFSKKPVVNETAYKQGIDLSFTSQDLNSIRKSLNDKGFDLVMGLRNLKMFLLTENF